MKGVWISFITRMMSGRAIFLVCLFFTGCDFLEDSGCVTPEEIKVQRNPEEGLVDFTSYQLEGKAYWFAKLSNESRMLDCTNICPNKPVVVKVKATELCDRFECHLRNWEMASLWSRDNIGTIDVQVKYTRFN